MKDKKTLALVRKASKKNQKAFAELCELKVNEVLFLCARVLGPGQDAQDAAQEVFIQMQKSIVRLRAPEAFNVWLNRLVYYTCQKMKRDDMKHKDMLNNNESFEDFLMDEDLIALPEAFLEDDERRQTIVALIDQLPEKYRTPIVLHYYQNLSYKEIARLTGVSTDSVNNSLRLARKYLRKQLEQQAGGLPMGTGMAAMLPLGAVLATAMVDSASAISPVLASQCLASAGVYTAFAGAGFAGTLGLLASKTGVQVAAASALAVVGAGVAVATMGNKSTHSIPAAVPASVQASVPVQVQVAQDASTVPQYTGAFSGRVYLKNKSGADPDAYDGLDGVVVEVVRVEDMSVVQTIVTSGGAQDGVFRFEGLPNGRYSLRMTLPGGLVCTKQGAAIIGGGQNTVQAGWVQKDGAVEFDIEGTEITGLDIEADVSTSLSGVIQLRLGGTLIEYDEGYLPGVVMQLLDPQGKVVATSAITEDGDYHFIDPMVCQTGDYMLHIHATDAAKVRLEIPDASIALHPGFT